MTTHSTLEILLERLQATQPESLTEEATRYLKTYYHGFSERDLAQSTPGDLLAAAMAHKSLAEHRQNGEVKVDVYQPDIETHGWQSKRCVIDVVCQDYPFLVDSLTMAINDMSLGMHLRLHPVISVERSDAGALVNIHPYQHGDNDSAAAIKESFIHFEVDAQAQDIKAAVEARITAVINDVDAASSDWPAMRTGVQALATELDASGDAQSAEFLRWLDNHHFTLLAYGETASFSESADLSNGLGLLNVEQPDINLLPALQSDTNLNVLVTKSRVRSHLHRASFNDCIVVKRHNSAGDVVGYAYLIGLFATVAYSREVKSIPLLSEKADYIHATSGWRPKGHAAKELTSIMDNLPRDLLFQLDQNRLNGLVRAIYDMQERQVVRLFVEEDACSNFYACLVYVPRYQFNSALRMRIQEMLRVELGGRETEFNVYFSESVLTRLSFIVHKNDKSAVDYNVSSLEQRIAEMSENWQDKLDAEMTTHLGETIGLGALSKYRDGFDAGYQQTHTVLEAVLDVQRVEAMQGPIDFHLYQPVVESDTQAHLKVYHHSGRVTLSDMIPIIENMGLRVLGETPSKLDLGDKAIWIHEFDVERRDGQPINVEAYRGIFEEALLHVWQQDCESNRLNRLVLEAGLDWRETNLILAIVRYLRQLRVRYSGKYMAEVLINNAAITGHLVTLFHARFKPGGTVDEAETVAQINASLESIQNIDEDRIIRSVLNIIQSVTRTNYYQIDGNGNSKPYLSLKVRSALVARMPEPKPLFEIFVFSPRVEGVHLRGGMVARGGLRWSDRPEDFRTEVLGLMKAQRVKNTVIVPQGSKGGFVAKKLPIGGDREAVQAEVIASYQMFIRGLLDVTDNLVGDKVVPPTNVVRLDADDPYLVVAADKGTATFSDIANAISEEYGFWLGDAFASGGSVGYDHKKMGITARGAWESVKRHFREMGHDTQTKPFTVVGIGDMGGDVFGNGMLLSEEICLVAAFNHLHIVIDPNPNPAVSFKERQRLFDLPRSSWTDYDESLLSEGSGIYSRSQKSIELSAQAREVLGISEESLSPNELIHELLKAPVDLLWNGGIGTYVKASTETDAHAQDKANDSLRVDANELRCKVIGEGGNLGFTQNSRIEFSELGGRVYTDFIDNSAGVDTSDHEVNIKILLNQFIEDGDMTVKQRNVLLGEMTDNVAALVLKDNYMQTQAIAMETMHGVERLGQHTRLIKVLEAEGVLNREIEFIPGEAELREMSANKTSLRAPELSVLISYSKMDLYDQLLACDLPDNDTFKADLIAYFPDKMQAEYGERLCAHRLGREIVATYLTNSFINQMGASFLRTVTGLTGQPTSKIVEAFYVVSKVLGAEALVDEINALDNQVSAQSQLAAHTIVARTIEQNIFTLLQAKDNTRSIGESIAQHKGTLDGWLSSAASDDAILAKFTNEAFPAELAEKIAQLPQLNFALEMVEIAAATEISVEPVAVLFAQLGERLQLPWLNNAINALEVDNKWHEIAAFGLQVDVRRQRMRLCQQMLSASSDSDDVFGAWEASHETSLQRLDTLRSGLQEQSNLDVTMLSIYTTELANTEA